jgi:hypothetical protein
VDAAVDASDVFGPDGCRLPGHDVLEGNVTTLNQEELAQLRGYREVTDILVVRNATDLSPLACLERAFNLGIMSSPGLTSLAGLERLAHVEVALTIDGNAGLTNLGGLDGLLDVGFLTIQDNVALTSVTGLSSIRVVSQRLAVSGSPLVTTLAGLATEEIGAVNLSGLQRLSNIDTLTGRTELRGLSLQSLPALYDLSPLASLERIRTELRLVDLPVSAVSLPRLSVVDGMVTISDNAAVRALDVPNLIRVGQEPWMDGQTFLAVERNPTLPRCNVERLVARLNVPRCNCADNTGTDQCAAP